MLLLLLLVLLLLLRSITSTILLPLLVVFCFFLLRNVNANDSVSNHVAASTNEIQPHPTPFPLHQHPPPPPPSQNSLMFPDISGSSYPPTTLVSKAPPLPPIECSGGHCSFHAPVDRNSTIQSFSQRPRSNKNVLSPRLHVIHCNLPLRCFRCRRILSR